MIPAWTLLLALLAGAAIGWYGRGWSGGRRGARPRSEVVAPGAGGEPAEPALKMGEVLSELERRYQGRVAGAEPPAKPARSRSRRPPRDP